MVTQTVAHLHQTLVEKINVVVVDKDEASLEFGTTIIVFNVRFVVGMAILLSSITIALIKIFKGQTAPTLILQIATMYTWQILRVLEI